jgi:hypothetical protein
MTTITYCDLASEYYMAYPVNGLISEAAGHGCRIHVAKTPPNLLSEARLANKDVGRLFALGIFQVNRGESSEWFCIDAHDDSGHGGYFRPILERVNHYFKLNCNPSAFGKDPTLERCRSKIHPLGCAFAVRPCKPWQFFPRLRPCPVYGWNWFSVKRRLRALQRVPTLESHLLLRTFQTDQDVFLVRRYYREPEHARSNELYCRIFECLKGADNFSGAIGFTGTSLGTPDRFRKHAFGQDRPYRQHLKLIARSRVCIYAPGTYDCLSFKFGQYLALGKPIVGMRLPSWPVADIERGDKELLDQQFCCTEPEEIPIRLAELLRDPERLDFLKINNIRIFECYFSPRSVAQQILRRVL